LTMQAGERRALLGPNGSGKTTLFNMIGGQTKPTSGKIFLFGNNATDDPPHRRAHSGLSRTFQITSLFPNLSVVENIHLAVMARSPIRYAPHRAAESYPGIMREVEELLADWRFAGSRERLVRDLSYGDQRKLEIAMALAHRPRLLLLDEPTAGLSAAETSDLIEVIKAPGPEVSILMIEHDVDVALDVADRISILDRGRIVAEGTAIEVRSNQAVQAIYFGGS